MRSDGSLCSWLHGNRTRACVIWIASPCSSGWVPNNTVRCLIDRTTGGLLLTPQRKCAAILPASTARTRVCSAGRVGQTRTPLGDLIRSHSADRSISSSMALFSRREVQQAIDQCATLMSAEAIARKVAELNASNENSLPTEWEVMVTAAASRYCPLQYEPAQGGNRRADLLMKPDGVDTPGCLVEVTTISDEHAHQSNPYDRVREAIYRRIRKLGAPTTGWNLRAEGKQIGRFGDAEMRLLLGSGRPEDLLDGRFHDFVRQVKAQPLERHVHEWRGELLGLTLMYDPNSKGVGGGHLLYTVVHSYERNPLARAMKAKAKQLRSTGHPGPYGLVVCDGDCDVLGSRLASNGTSFSVGDILFHHARRNRHLSFVLVLHVETRPPPFLGPRQFEYVLRGLPCIREGACRLAAETLKRLTKAVASLPQPVASPANAARCYVHQYENEWWQFPGGSVTRSERSIKMSSRALLEVLAGHRTPEDFFKAFRDKPLFSGNHFDRQRLEGRCITGVKFTKGPADDDEIEFTFGPPDAAASRYRVPSQAEMPENDVR